MKKMIALAVVLLLARLCPAQFPAPVTAPASGGTEIWSGAPHNAFTDLIEYKGYIYCSFREGSGHVPGSNGAGRILRTKDGNTWESFALIRKDGIDLRDQKLSVMPDGRMLCLMGGSVYDTAKKPSRLLGMYPHVAFMGKDMKFTTPEKAVIGNPGHHWVWRLTWYKGVGYGIDYGSGRSATLVKTTDGKTFTGITDLEVDGMPNESTIRFDKKGKMYILIRREQGDKLGVLATGKAPFTSFSYQKLDYRLGGPDFMFTPDQKKLIVGTRLYLPGGAKTGILVTDLSGRLLRTVELESGGDCSYPGMLVRRKELWISYYSSHRGKTNIYFTRIPLNDLLK
ncbi:hypothetical protein [Niabella drilacis]|uniref:Exo-alpha-sialidase n=1 Tax=Niabella drilacis (strain DSM 25811 / CCM 8410 / CCUG 62505 / LMG 26954 / E90) TaxID=1285928 RepID=A0A1G6LTV2_NIADE|nr:hypothetical protein [Niabella drilacis]SDC46728.1 hypothetical protein SAMN04487894_102461 [Niabella drilacis]